MNAHTWRGAELANKSKGEDDEQSSRNKGESDNDLLSGLLGEEATAAIAGGAQSLATIAAVARGLLPLGWQE